MDHVSAGFIINHHLKNPNWQGGKKLEQWKGRDKIADLYTFDFE